MKKLIKILFVSWLMTLSLTAHINYDPLANEDYPWPIEPIESDFLETDEHI
ncbi:hypothetical protein [Alkalibacillus aidingensis]|uniref:hypothetical protein n=1 Tax=Alkalibacillus aidingensis TaxID=2747607 RepID=UPI00166012A4|nr:hypothetical protein [Alkalibacillus aidingensis]